MENCKRVTGSCKKTAAAGRKEVGVRERDVKRERLWTLNESMGGGMWQADVLTCESRHLKR